ncbi:MULTISPECIES: helix-turn-helix domain-containing protein [unclassified Devosia]|uniref:winged helix-turn-helix transcriptional regulator n=1 Tax=unclassified Devosia TaxID=196773 RepID=UPI000FDBE4DF|nr:MULTISPECIES: helix-turn-helix domain-containing protein [unclassified Devosia]
MQDGTFTTSGYAEETRTARGTVFASDCSTRKLLDRIGDKWSVLILLVLGDSEARFNELRRQIGGISQKMLSQTLQSLRRDGLITREVEPTTPVTVTYAITPLGRELLTALRMMIDWAETRLPEVEAAQRLHDGASQSLD